MGHGRHRLLRNLVSSAGVAGTVALIGLGLPAVNNAIPAARPVPAGRPYAVAAGVTVEPPPGASLDVTATQPGARQGSALFVVGPVRYALVVTRFGGNLAQAAARLRAKITDKRGYQIAGGEQATVTAQGVAGRQGMYASPGRGGRYAVFLAGGVAVEVTIAGNDIDLRAELPSIAASVRTIRFAGGGP